MRKRLLEAALAVALEETVRNFIVSLLPYVWVAILLGITFEVVNSKTVKPHLVGLLRRIGAKYMIPAYLLVAITGAGLSCLYLWGVRKALGAPEEPATTSRMPSASEIATAFADKTRVREQFAREMDKPVVGMYMVISLVKPLPVERIMGIAGVVAVIDRINAERPQISFGFHPDVEEWTEIPGNKKISMPGVRSEIWTAPGTFTPDTKINVTDNLLAYRFTSLDRIEAGAIMATPFTKVGELDRAAVMVKATRDLIEYIQTITLIVNDYVVFELDRTAISGWSPPPPPMMGQVVHGTLDSVTGKMTDRQVVKSVPLDPNFMLPPDFKQIPFFTALIAPGRSQAPPPMNNTASVDLADFPVRIHRVMGKATGGDKAGNRSFTILPGEQGWLPKETRLPQ